MRSLFVTMTAILLTSAQSRGDFEMEWRTIDGGGGKSSGGAFTMEGTIGQPDAGVTAADNLVLAGGFWQPELDDPCPADINRDGEVDVNDLNIVFLCWGTDGMCLPGVNADISGPEPRVPDGIVGVDDLIKVIVCWGPCP